MTSELQGSGPTASSEKLSSREKTELGEVTAPFAEMTMNAINGLFAVLARSYPMIDTETADAIINNVLTVERPTAAHDQASAPDDDPVVVAEVTDNDGFSEGLDHAAWRGERPSDQTPVIDMQSQAVATAGNTYAGGYAGSPVMTNGGYAELGEGGIGTYPGGKYGAMIDDLKQEFAAPSATDPSILDNQTGQIIADRVGNQLDTAAIRASIDAIHGETDMVGARS